MTFVRRVGVTVSMTLVGLLAATGCSSSGGNLDVAEGHLTPDDVQSLDEQRQLCSLRVKENGASRRTDLDVGVVRWKCGDVQGVNNSPPNPKGKADGTACTSPGLQADPHDFAKLSKAEQVKQGAAMCRSLICGDDGKCAPVSDLGQEYCEFHAVQEGKVVDKAPKSAIKPGKVECIFTGVYSDVKGDSPAANKKFGESLNKQLT